MSTTRDWAHGGEDWNLPHEWRRLRLRGAFVWAMAIVVTTIVVLALQQLYG